MLILPMIMRTQTEAEIVEMVPEKATRVRMETREVLVVMAPEMVLLVVVPGLAEVAQIQEVRPVEVALAQEVMQAEVMQAEVVRLVVLVVEILV